MVKRILSPSPLPLSVLTAIFQVNLGQPVFIKAKDDGGGGDNWTTGAISRAKLQSNHHHQQTNIQWKGLVENIGFQCGLKYWWSGRLWKWWERMMMINRQAGRSQSCNVLTLFSNIQFVAGVRINRKLPRSRHSSWRGAETAFWPSQRSRLKRNTTVTDSNTGSICLNTAHKY